MEEKIKTVCCNAERYLLNFWEQRGRFEDFQINPPGCSNQWITAYVANCLWENSYSDSIERKEKILRQAEAYLMAAIREDGGIGYNENCRSDCDSTAEGVRFLKRRQGKAPDKMMQFLCKCWKQDGGFATYCAEGIGRWNDSHLDVTLNTAPLLKNILEHNIRVKERMTGYIKAWFQAFMPPPAYWWETDLYCASLAVECSRVYGWKDIATQISQMAVCHEIPENIFEAALLLNVLKQCDSGREGQKQLENQLLEKQNPDGSFPGQAQLRVTDPACARPWIGGTNEITFDQNRLYTTATVLKAFHQTGGC